MWRGGREGGGVCLSSPKVKNNAKSFCLASVCGLSALHTYGLRHSTQVRFLLLPTVKGFSAVPNLFAHCVARMYDRLYVCEERFLSTCAQNKARAAQRKPSTERHLLNTAHKRPELDHFRPTQLWNMTSLSLACSRSFKHEREASTGCAVACFDTRTVNLQVRRHEVYSSCTTSRTLPGLHG